VLYYRLLGLQENEIAIKLGISQPTVNKISNAISWNVVNDALSLLENIIN
jgi:DNA-binding transcriptional regulator LsrR (DeoR family)